MVKCCQMTNFHLSCWPFTMAYCFYCNSVPIVLYCTALLKTDEMSADLMTKSLSRSAQRAQHDEDAISSVDRFNPITTVKNGIRDIRLLRLSLVVDPTVVSIWACSLTFVELNRISLTFRLYKFTPTPYRLYSRSVKASGNRPYFFVGAILGDVEHKVSSIVLGLASARDPDARV